MTQCEHCSADIPPGRRQRFCSSACGIAFHNASRNRGARVVDVEARPIDRQAMELIISGHLPAPFNVDPHDARPLWDICGIAALLDQRPDSLVELLIAAGPAHLPVDRGVPSSWQSLIERC